MLQTLIPKVKTESKSSSLTRGTFAQKAHTGRRGVAAYMNRSDDTPWVPTSQSYCFTDYGRADAGPSTPSIPVDVPAPVTEGVTLLPLPDITPLLQELRLMVTGQNVLSETKKAYAPAFQYDIS